MEKVKILFFSADPKSAPPHGRAPRLLLDVEVREIRQKVRTARYRDDLDLDTHLARRTLTALEAELKRREKHLREHDARDVIQLEQQNSSPLPKPPTARSRAARAFLRAPVFLCRAPF